MPKPATQVVRLCLDSFRGVRRSHTWLSDLGRLHTLPRIPSELESWLEGKALSSRRTTTFTDNRYELDLEPSLRAYTLTLLTLSKAVLLFRGSSTVLPYGNFLPLNER